MAGRDDTKRIDRAAAASNWDAVADWYDHWARHDGSPQQRLSAIPALMGLLTPGPGERILDLGCGTGVLAPYIQQANADYTGLDAGPKLLAAARRRHAGRGRFVLADATRLQTTSGLQQGEFDACVFLLSLQDMDPLEQALDGAAWALSESGRMAILLTHPCFRVPRQSGWGWDEKRRLTFRRIDRYLGPLAVPMRPTGGRPLTSYHRPLQAYVEGLAARGFAVDRLVEVPPDPRALPKTRRPVNVEIPVFLGLRAVRKRGAAAPP